MRTRIWMLALAVMCGLGSQAQGLGTIEGKVLDESGAGAIGAVAVAQQGERRVGAVCDDAGHYTLKPLNAGTWSVTITNMGYTTLVVEGVQVLADDITRLKTMELALQESGVVITRERWYPSMIQHDNTGVTKISARQIKNSPMTKDPVAIVSILTPGVYRAPNGDGLFFRGSRSENTCYFVDGMKVGPSLVGVPNKAISSLNVYTGGVPAKYGDVTGGVVAIETMSYFDMLEQSR